MTPENLLKLIESLNNTTALAIAFVALVVVFMALVVTFSALRKK